MSSTSLPAGYSAPSLIITSTDHGGWIVITTALGLVFVLLFLVIRLFIRLGLSPPIRYDDTVLGIATITFVVQAAAVFVQVNRGFGKSIDLLSSSALVEVQKVTYSSDILSVLDLYLSKASVVLLFMRLTPNKSQIRFLQTLLAISTLWIVISIFIVALRCNLSQPWIQYNVQCTGLFARWAFVAAGDVVIEICLFAVSIYLVYNLQMTLKNKLTVIMVFAFRLPMIAFCFTRLRFLNIEIHSPNPTIDGVPAVILMQIELFYSLISATIPCLNPFLKAMNTNYGTMGRETVANKTYGSSRANSYGLNTMGSGPNRKRRNQDWAEASEKTASIDEIEGQVYQGNFAGNMAQATSEGHTGAPSIGSNESRKMIIKKEMHWVVETSSLEETRP